MNWHNLILGVLIIFLFVRNEVRLSELERKKEDTDEKL